MISELNERSRTIFRQIVDAYLESGEPVGSRTIARRLSGLLSPASIRNVMADLEEMGLLMAPHTSAGRMPTDMGLRLFVDGLLEVGNLPEEDRLSIEERCAGAGSGVAQLLEQATAALSGLSHCAGLVVAPKTESPVRHIEFVSLSSGRALAVLVTESGVVENRVISIPPKLPSSALIQATNYLSARLLGRTIAEAGVEVMAEIESHKVELDRLTEKVVQAGLAVWSGDEQESSLIVRGQANLLDDITALTDLEQIRTLFKALETKESLIKLLCAADAAEGVQIFIGAESQLFGIAGCSAIVGPYQDQRNQVVGAIGVIGPVCMNYARIIPMVNYTAKVIERMI